MLEEINTNIIRYKENSPSIPENQYVKIYTNDMYELENELVKELLNDLGHSELKEFKN